jgi:hypothetical protein
MIKTDGVNMIYRIVNCAVVRGTRNTSFIYKTNSTMVRNTRKTFQIINRVQ